MNEMGNNDLIIGRDDLILVTGATGFIGSRVVRALLDRGFRNLRCFTRRPGEAARAGSLFPSGGEASVEFVTGNLLSPKDCATAVRGASVIFHLAAGRGEKSFPDAFMNSAVTTRNLLEACVGHPHLKRFVNISSFAAYTNRQKPRGRLLDESCSVDPHPELRGDAYTFAKVKQDEIVEQYGREFAIPHVTLRPGHVYGPGNLGITGRVGIGTFGVFLHLGGSNVIPFTYVDNCAEAIVLAGVKQGVDGEVFNVVDDDLCSSRRFLRLYKKNVKPFRSLYVPHVVSYGLCYLWEWYARWSEGQLPPVFNRSRWHAHWKKTRYTNQKLKDRLGWAPRVSTQEGFQRYFEACRSGAQHA